MATALEGRFVRESGPTRIRIPGVLFEEALPEGRYEIAIWRDDRLEARRTLETGQTWKLVLPE